MTQRIKSDLERRVVLANRQAARKALVLARSMSSGPVPAWVMRYHHWHPFAIRRWARPQLDPEIINAQSGDFRRAWKVHDTLWGALLYNDAPYAKYLRTGTKYMYHRPIGHAIIRLMKPVYRDLLAQALRRR